MAQALAAAAFRGCRSLVDEDEPLGITIELAIEPDYAGAQDIRTLLQRRAPSSV